MASNNCNLLICSSCHFCPTTAVMLDCTHVLCESCALSILDNSSSTWVPYKEYFKIGQCPECTSLFIKPAMFYITRRNQMHCPDLELWREIFPPFHHVNIPT